MPIRIDRSHVPPPARHVVTRADTTTTTQRRDEVNARAITRANERTSERAKWAHGATHLGNVALGIRGRVWSHRHTCDYCGRIVATLDAARNAQRVNDAQLAAHGRAEARNASYDATRRTGDVPSRVTRKTRKTRNVSTPTLTGDRTRNATSRRVKATQRYDYDATTRNVSDTTTTNENDATRRVARNVSPLVIRDHEGRIDPVATLFVLSHYRHALACLTHTNEGDAT